MRDCPNAEIRDLLPDFVHRTLGDGELGRVAAHVSSCAECRAEVALLRSAAAALRARPVVDVASIVRRLPAPPAAPARLVLDGSERSVPRPVAARPRRRIGARWAAGVAAAAAAVIAVVVARDPAETTVRPESVVEAVEGVRPGTPAAPTSLGRGDSGTTPAAAPPGREATAGLAMTLAGEPADLTDGELEALLGALETVDAMPSAEPEEPADPLRVAGEEFR